MMASEAITPAPTPHSVSAHLPDWGFAGVLEAAEHFPGGVPGAIVSIFLVLYLLIILFRLLTGDEVEFLGLFRTSRRLRDARETIGQLGLLLRGHGIMFKSIESTLKRIDAFRGGSASVSRDDALRYLCEWFPKGLTYGSSDATKMVVFVPDGKGNLIVRSHSGLSPEAIGGIIVPINPNVPSEDTFAAMAFRFKQPVASPNITTDPRYAPLRGHPPSHPYVSVMAIPIERNGATVGAFTVDSQRDGRFGPDEVRFGQLFAWLFAELL